MRVLFLMLLLWTSFNPFADGQRTCNSMHYLEQQIQEDPDRSERLMRIENATRAYLENSQRDVEGIITIPVVFHIIWNTSTENISDAQIQSQLDILNEDFRRMNQDANDTWSQAADTEIEFCLASLDPNGASTTGITRTFTSSSSFSANDNMKFDASGGHDAWPAGDYLNFWVCDLSGGLLGYAQFPGGPDNTDGVVCDYQYVGNIGTATAPFDLGRTATHEVGHWLNLRHIWGDGGCNVDDFVSDTPTSDAPNYGCATGHTSCNTTDMVENYMDYSDDGCMNLYTNGQRDRMRALFDTGGARESLLSSNGCGTAGPPTCDDGIQNGEETGVDCGGPDCPTCPTCDDGMQNGEETGIDCGGPDCPACPCTGTEVTMTIILDNYPEETSWTLIDENGATIASGGTYGNLPDGSTVTETFCLAEGCYDYTIDDSYGDGICCGYGNGSYIVEDENGNVLASGGEFGSSETTNFCVGGGSSPVLGCTDPNAHNYDPNATQDDGSCETCTDGELNGDETGVDCGGSLCAPCSGGCTYENIDFNNFEGGFGIWNDGGSDCRINLSDQSRAYSAPYCVRIRDNSNSAHMTTDDLNLTAYDELTVDFTFLALSMEPGEDFWLQVSTNGGSSYTTVAVWASGVDFENNVRSFENVVIDGPFSANTRLRFRCDASVNNDRIFLDDVNIDGCNGGNNRETELEVATLPTVQEDVLTIDNLYPNPAKDEVTIRYDVRESKETTIQLFDMTGKQLEFIQLVPAIGTQETTIDVRRFEQGMYFLRVHVGDQSIIKKFVIAK